MQNIKIIAFGGRGFIIPDYNLWSVGLHLVSKYTLSDRSKLQAGIRFDHGAINTKEYYDWFPSTVEENGVETEEYLQRADKIDKVYENISWSLGYVYNHQALSLKANIGKSFRMPIAKELAANGVNYHRFSYEEGKSDLDAEVSYQIDIGAEYNKNHFAVGFTPFVNYFPNYIYLNPSDKHDSQYGLGNQIFYYTQSSVFRYGWGDAFSLGSNSSITTWINGVNMYTLSNYPEQKRDLHFPSLLLHQLYLVLNINPFILIWHIMPIYLWITG